MSICLARSWYRPAWSWLAGSPCQFLLDSAEGYCIDDGRMVILHIVFRTFSVIDHHLFRQAVLDVGFVDDGIALVFLIGVDQHQKSRQEKISMI